MSARIPIIYVRGYAGGPSGIDTAVDDAFYGFNKGSTVVRVGGDGEPLFHQFESPLLRLMIDERYQLLVEGDQRALLARRGEPPLDPATIWVHRFYDPYSSIFGPEDADRFDIVAAAEGLYEFVQLVRSRVRGRPPVYLVAHSMGGLVCRTMMQRVCAAPGQATQGDDAGGDDAAGDDAGGEAPRETAGAMVAKLVTMGTPHGGIETRFALANLLNEHVGVHGSEMFARDNMHLYLRRDGGAPPPDWSPQDLPEGEFDPANVFCIVGTNAQDYNLAKKAIGPKSEGRGSRENAYVRGAPRAFIHRSHSGSYGLVNSEEAYQNLRRFLFATWRVRVHLDGVDLTGDRERLAAMSPEELAELDARLREDRTEFDAPEAEDFWQADVQLSIRGLPIILHEQSVARYCPVQLTQEQVRRRLARVTRGSGPPPEDQADTPVPLTEVHLLDRRHFATGEDADEHEPLDPSRYALRLRAFRMRREGGFLGLGEHLEQVADWEDTLIVDVGPDPDNHEALAAWAAWNSAIEGPHGRRRRIADSPVPIENGRATIELPEMARAGVFGPDARLTLVIDRVAPAAAPDAIHI